MKKLLLFTLLMALTLIVTPDARALEMENEGAGGHSKLHIHGYGELHYNVPTGGGDSSMDLHRMVWGISYEFSDSISLHTEVDFEHSAQEMELEFAYIDFLINPAFNVRSGVMLMPVGSLNEAHEPPLFYSVERPLLHSKIIPTTWQEGGIGVFGSPMEGLKYRVYLVSGLAGEGFSASDGIRGGRGKVAGGKEGKPKTGEELAIVARLEYNPAPGLDLGVSYYTGGVDQVNSIGGDPNVGIYEVDGRVRMAGFDFQGTYAKIDVDDADKISKVAGESIGSEMVGWYLELAYHLAHLTHTNWDLVPFIRVSEVNTQDEMPVGFTATAANDREITSAGLAFYPHSDIAFKADFQNTKDGAGKNKDQYNLGMAYMF